MADTDKSSHLLTIIGIVAIFIGLACIFLVYGYFFGVSGGSDVAITPNGVSLIFALMFLILLLGSAGGLLIGKSLSKTT
ncbi:hypothetical protein JXA31_08015 [Candidatus Bathyarchaeota archaeon]|nr:hypothetical protein [Candidatus Bathyarchaeota archaeon]